jgi:hypothetical protein
MEVEKGEGKAPIKQHNTTMKKMIKQKHGGALVRLEKGETNNPNGRPRKWISNIKDTGYKVSEVNDCIQVLLSMTEDELSEVSEIHHATVLEKTIAAALKKGMEEGSLHVIETLLSRTYGKPKEQAAISADMTVHRIILGM